MSTLDEATGRKITFPEHERDYRVHVRISKHITGERYYLQCHIADSDASLAFLGGI